MREHTPRIRVRLTMGLGTRVADLCWKQTFPN